MSDERTLIAMRGSAVRIGTELNQTYCIDSLLGVGGMGEVFKGHNIQTGDPVAIKIVLPEFAQDDTILNLFRKEARILNHLNHEAIVRYYVFSIDPVLSRPYLAMEYVDGPSLAAHVKSAPLAHSEFMPLLRRLADGLHRAHGAGVIHRDMSPDNVILAGGLVQNAKIIDFGIARSANVGGETLLGGSFAGKYNFVSPEQLGLHGGEVTPKSDVYSLALVMVAAMLGRPLDMSGSQVDVIEKRRSVPDLSGIPKQFHPVLTAMLLPDPAKRPADMAAIRDWPDMQPSPKAKGEKPTKAAVSTLAKATPPKPSNALRNGVLAVAVVAVIGFGALGGWIFMQNGDLPGDNKIAQNPASTPTGNDSSQDRVPRTPDGNGQVAKNESSTSVPIANSSSQTTSPKTPDIAVDNDSQAAKVAPPTSSSSSEKAQPSSPPKTPDGGQTTKELPSTIGHTGSSTPPKAIESDNQTAKVETSTSDPNGIKPPPAAPPKIPDSASQAAKAVSSTAGTTNDASSPTTASKTPDSAGQVSKAVPSTTTSSNTPSTIVPKTPDSTSPATKIVPSTAFAVLDKSPPSTTQELSANKTLPKPPGGLTGQTTTAFITPPPPVVRPSAASLGDFVNGFSADNCFAATTDKLTATSARVTALGTSEASQSFSDAFRQKAGFIPAVTLDPVTSQQCGFVSALRRMSVPGALPLNIALSKSEIRGGNGDTGASGDPLTVSVTGAGDRNIYLFVMDHDGGVQNINRLCPSCITMKTGEIEAGLSLSAPAKVDGESRPPFFPMLVFAIASPRPLISVNSQDAFDASDFIDPFLKEIANTNGVATAVGFVKLRDQ